MGLSEKLSPLTDLLGADRRASLESMDRQLQAMAWLRRQHTGAQPDLHPPCDGGSRGRQHAGWPEPCAALGHACSPGPQQGAPPGVLAVALAQRLSGEQRPSTDKHKVAAVSDCAHLLAEAAVLNAALEAPNAPA